MRNFKLTVEYDGAAYCGWQRQKNGPSVQQILEDAAGRVTSGKVKIVGSGRTDAGVHAIAQVASFRSDTNLAAEKIFRGINSLLPLDIVVKQLEEVSPDFHAQRDVKGKTYVYRICNAPLRPVIGREYCWHVRAPLNVDAMREAAGKMLGTHDYSCFCATGTDVTDRVRTLRDIQVKTGANGMLEITVEAKGFFKYMVRNIVGTLVEVGRGKRKPDDMKDIIASRDRKIAGATAPAQGLFLKEVKYSKV